MGSVEKLVKALEALKVSSEAAAAAAAASDGGGGGGGGGIGSGVVGSGGIGSGVVSGILGAATRRKDGANLTRREKVHHCNVIADNLNAVATRYSRIVHR